MTRIYIAILVTLALHYGSAEAQPPLRVIDVVQPVDGPLRDVAVDQPETSLGDAGLRFAWEAEPPSSPFAAGSCVGVAYATSTYHNFADDVRFHSVNIGAAYYFVDNLSLSLEARAIYGDRVVPRDDSLFPNSLNFDFGNEGSYFGGALQSVMRCHFVNYGSWSLFVEAGAGLSYLSKSVPADGTNFNFLLLAGLGLTKQISDSVHFMIGHRWVHLSNASTQSRNPAYDGKMIYAGFLKEF